FHSKRRRRERLRRLSSLIKVATSYTGSAYMEFAHYSYRLGAKPPIQNVDLGVRYWTPDWATHDAFRESMFKPAMSHVIGTFCRPIGVQQRDFRIEVEPVPTQIRRQGFAGWNQPAQHGQI